MPLRRREFLTLGATAAGVAVAGTAIAQPVAPAPEQHRGAGSQPDGMLYDATHCIGCRSCQRACRQRAKLPPVTDDGLHEQPRDLSSRCLTLIKGYHGKTAANHSFVKRQCMHCLQPACASACPVGALERSGTGAVVYHEELCIGCRYCQIACPFDVPKFDNAEMVPALRKCDFCSDLIARAKPPRCVAVCPSGALAFGKRKALLQQARRRIKDAPAWYVSQVFGESEFGGTAALYLASVPFDKLGFPGSAAGMPLPALTERFVSWVPEVIIGGAGVLIGARLIAGRRGGEADGGATAGSDSEEVQQ